MCAWFREQGTIIQVGVVLEFVGGGSLETVYAKDDYTLQRGLNVARSAATGIAYMHSMPTPIAHRDVKSANILVNEDGVTGKIADCGESR